MEVIDEAIATLLGHPEADALRSVGPPVQTPYKMWRIVDGYLSPLLALDGVREPYCMPRQLLPEVYWQNGYVDVLRPRAVLEKNSMWGECAIPLVIDERLLELDYPEHIPAVEAALEQLQDGTASASAPVRHPV